MNRISSVSFCGSGSESAGSLAMRDNPDRCPTCGRVNFQGNGSESTGSLADISNPLEQPPTDSVNFKGSNQNKKKKGLSVFGAITGIAILAAGSIVGLGYAHKSNAFAKMNDGKIKDILSKLEPAAKKCHEWCATIKSKGLELWGKIKNVFSSKKD